MVRHGLWPILRVMTCLFVGAYASAAENTDLTEMSIQDLINIEVFGASKFSQRLKARFEINVKAAENARLKISSQLLNLTEIIREEPKSLGI